ncbi:HAD domain-containing protein [Roseateles sp. BYS78W]|uniref:HAD domain-containing protein n=1 Tax=Pelomonas candidula TaxID=3299025 RepID=A0ABW7HE85_9BURK
MDVDDIICIGKPYGGYDLFDDDRPADLFDRLWHPPSKKALLDILDEFGPRVVMTTSWLRLMERDGFESLFRRTGLELVAASLHSKWEAPANMGMTRHDAILKWLWANYTGEQLVVLDDDVSGTGLRGSKLDKLGRVVFCEVGVGLHVGHLPQVRRALVGGAS